MDAIRQQIESLPEKRKRAVGIFFRSTRMQLSLNLHMAESNFKHWTSRFLSSPAPGHNGSTRAV